MRLVELFLMSLPLVLVLAWFLGARHGSFRALAVVACGLAALGGLLVWMGDHRSFSGSYRPAHLENGKIVPSQGS
jgi:hypothetical protein